MRRILCVFARRKFGGCTVILRELDQARFELELPFPQTSIHCRRPKSLPAARAVARFPLVRRGFRKLSIPSLPVDHSRRIARRPGTAALLPRSADAAPQDLRWDTTVSIH